MTNREIRLLYEQQVKEIERSVEDLRRRGVPAHEIAYAAWTLRRVARQEAREKMESPDDVAVLRRRDLAKYGDPDGPSFDQIVQRAREKGHAGDDVYEEVVRSALRTDPVTNVQVLGGDSPSATKS